MTEETLFHVKIGDGPELTIRSLTSIYVWAVASLPGVLGIETPSDVTIWVPDLVAAGYGPYHYRLESDDFGRPVVTTLVRLPEPSV